MIDTIETLTRDIPKWKRMGIWPADPQKAPPISRAAKLQKQRQIMRRLRAERSKKSTAGLPPRVRAKRQSVIRKELKRIRSMNPDHLTHDERLKLITPLIKRQQNIRAHMRRYRKTLN